MEWSRLKGTTKTSLRTRILQHLKKLLKMIVINRQPFPSSILDVISSPVKVLLVNFLIVFKNRSLSFDTKTFSNEIWRQATSTQKAGRLQLQTATVGGSPSKQGSRQARRREKTCGTPGDSADDRIGQQQHLQSQAWTCTPIKTATEPIDQESDRTATAGAATQSDINLLAYFPMSSETGYRYIYIYIYAYIYIYIDINIYVYIYILLLLLLLLQNTKRKHLWGKPSYGY